MFLLYFFFPQRESQILLHYINEITKAFRDLTMELKSNKNVPTHLSNVQPAQHDVRTIVPRTVQHQTMQNLDIH